MDEDRKRMSKLAAQSAVLLMGVWRTDIDDPIERLTKLVGDLEKLNSTKAANQFLVRDIAERKSSYLLLQALRSESGLFVHPQLGGLIADLLEGTTKASPKAPWIGSFSTEYVLERYEWARQIVQGQGHAISAKELPGLLDRVGYYDYLASKGKNKRPPQTGAEIKRAAIYLIAWEYGATWSVVEEKLFPRKARTKRAA